MRGEHPRAKWAMIACVCMIVIFLTVPAICGAAVKIWYVSQTGGSTPGNSPSANSFLTIQSAVNVASNGDTVKVGPGIYTETISFKGKNITVISEQGPEKTVIDGSSGAGDIDLKRVVTFEKQETSAAVFSGFTITKGLNGGIYCSGSSPTLENLKIIGNTAKYSGGGIFCDNNARPTIRNTVISENSAGSRGGGIYCRKESSLVLENILMTKNTAPSGAGIFCEHSSLALTHVTVSGNSGTQGSGISLSEKCTLTVKNSILRNRIFLEDTALFSSISVSHSNLQGGKNGITGAGNLDWLIRNSDSDPLFMDEKNGNYRLSLCSPCIGAGTSEGGIPATDIAGNPRPAPSGSSPDMGAYEHPLNLPSCTPKSIYVDPAFTGTATGGPKAPYPTLGEAVSDASPGSVLYVADGVFKETVEIVNIKGLKIEGGWSDEAGVWTRKSPVDPNFSVIVADTSPVILADRSPDTLIEGFTIVGPGIGVKVLSSANVEIRSNIIRIDPLGETVPSDVSAGIRYEASSGSVTKNRIHIVNINTAVPLPADAVVLSSLSGNLRLENNIIALQGENLQGIREIGANATPVSFLANDFYAPENAVLYHDENGQGNITVCENLNNRTLADIQERGGNFCSLLMMEPPCLPPCSDALALPAPEDTDNDGMPDNVEIHYFGDTSHDGSADSDSDGLTDAQEYISGTDPISADTDKDGIPDGWEVENGTDPLSDNSKQDSDSDGYNDLSEYNGGTDPLDAASYPFAQNDVVTTDEDKAITVKVLNNDSGTGLSLSHVTMPGHGTVTQSSSDLRYSPDSGFWGKDSFVYTAVNSSGTVASASVTVYVRPLSTPENSLIFDGVKTYIIRKAMGCFPSKSLTVEFWIKSYAPRYQTLVSYTAKGSEKMFSVDLNENFNFNIWIAGEIKRIPDISVADGKWHHIAVTWQSSDGKIEIFKDGFSGFSGNLGKGVSLISGGTLLLGRGQTCIGGECVPGTDGFAGSLDDLRLWNAVRTETEIQTEMTDGFGVRGSGSEGLAVHWRFNEGTRSEAEGSEAEGSEAEGSEAEGQIVFDYSENANHAQLGAADSADDYDPNFSADSPLAEHKLYVDALFGNLTETGEAALPYKTLGAAIRNARAGTLIRVARGLYPEALSIANIVGIRLEGGWDSTSGNWTRDDPPDPNATILMAMNSATGCLLNHAPCTAVEGFTIMASDTGAEVTASPNVSLSSNIIHAAGGKSSTTGIRWSGSSGQIAGNRVHIISAPEGTGSGMVLQSLSGNLRIENNIIYLQGTDVRGIAETGPGVSPSAFLNNEFYADETAVLYQTYESGGIADSGAVSLSNCAALNDSTLNRIPERGGNFCNLLPLYDLCSPPCSDAVAIPPPQDRDKDGMPDNWELYYFGDLSRDGTGDYDTDGKTDRAEYQKKMLPSDWHVRVLIYPEAAATQGGAWSADAGLTWHASAETLSDSGTYTLEFKEIEGWESPGPRTLSEVEGSEVEGSEAEGSLESGEAVTLIAVYTQGNYLLEVTAEGCDGEVKIAGKSETLPWSGRFVSGDQVNIEAFGGEECRFDHWTGSLISPISSADIVIDGDKFLSAVFAKRALRFSRPDPNSLYMEMEGRISDVSGQTIRGEDEVAAFVKGENDRLIVAGHGFCNKDGYVLRIYGDDGSTPEKNGAAPGDTIILKTYNDGEGKEHRLEPVGGAGWEQGIRKQTDWQYLPVRRIPLHTGWNLISFDTDICYHTGTRPDCDMIAGIEYEQVKSIGDILYSIAGQYEDVRAYDCNGAVSYHPNDTWSDMTYMAPGYGYEIRIREDAESDENGLIYLETEGHRISGDTPIPLHPGWNLTGCLGDKVRYAGDEPSVSWPEDSVMCRIGSIREAFCSVDGKYVQIRGFDRTGEKIYNRGSWSDMSYAGPGYGYWINISDTGPTALVWDSSCAECTQDAPSERASVPEHFTGVTLTKDSCRYIGKISIADIDAADHEDEVAVFAYNGNREILTGAAIVGETVPGYYLVRVYADDPDTLEKDGAGNGEVLIFKVWDKSENREYTVPPSSAYMTYEADESGELLQPSVPPVWKDTAAGFGLLNLTLPLLPGDTDGSGVLDLRDAILSLQAAADALESPVYPDAEISGDRRVGLAEAVYALRGIAGL